MKVNEKIECFSLYLPMKNCALILNEKAITDKYLGDKIAAQDNIAENEVCSLLTICECWYAFDDVITLKLASTN